MKETWKTVLYNKLAISYAFLFSINALTGAIMASFLNAEWRDMSSTSKFLVIVAIIQIWTGTILAFLNKTMSRIEKNEPPIPTGATELITKEQTQIIGK